MTVDRVRAAANVLVERRFVVVDLDTVELLIRTFIRHDVAAQGSPKIMQGALNCALQTESPKLRGVLLSEIRKLERGLPEHLLPLADQLEASLGSHPPKGFPKAIESQSKGCVAVTVPGGVGVEPPEDCERCGRHPALQHGLCSACLGRELESQP